MLIKSWVGKKNGARKMEAWRPPHDFPHEIDAPDRVAFLPPHLARLPYQYLVEIICLFFFHFREIEAKF